MTSEQSNDPRTIPPENVDDFKVIRGIGPAIERRLQAAGIHTFSRLAVLTPDELAGLVSNLAGLTPKRIASMDWIGQAHNLASEIEYSQPLVTAPASEGRQHYSTFTVELLLDEDNNIRRTRVVHVQSGRESAWASWNPTQLENLILQGIGMPLPSYITTDGIAQKQNQEANQTVQGVFLSGELRLQDILVIKEENRAVTRMLHYGQPYSLQIILDFTDVVIAGDSPLDYEATVYARDLRGLLRETIGVSSGTIQKSESPTIYMHGNGLNRGIYQLGAVAVFSPQAGLLPQSSLTAMLDRNLLQVY